MKKDRLSWDWWVILLWAYSSLVALFFLISMVFFPSWVNSEPTTFSSDQETIAFGLALFLPQAVFLILSGIRNLKK